MRFTWPLLLLLALLVPVVLGVYLWKLRRRRKQAVRYSSVALLRAVMPRSSRWKRHLPVALMLAGLGALAVASARPNIVRPVPIERTSIILALDISGSMCATDVEPNRLSVAQQAARDFVSNQADGARMGLVVFSGSAQLAVPPTSDREALLAAIDGLVVGRGTAIGAAMVKSLDAIATINPDVAPVGDAPPPKAGPPGASGYVPDVVVLLTDGANTRGIPPLEAVPYAVERGVRVYTIGFGTTSPTQLACNRSQLGAAAFGDTPFGGGGGGFGGGGFGGGGPGGGGPGGRGFLVADEPTLTEVAAATGGEYYRAEDAEQLRGVFEELPKDIDSQDEEREVTAVFAAFGASLAAVAMAASIRWSPYP